MNTFGECKEWMKVCLVFLRRYEFRLRSIKHEFLKAGTFCTHFSNVHTCNNFTLHELLNMVGLENYNFKILGGAEKLVRAVTAALLCWA